MNKQLPLLIVALSLVAGPACFAQSQMFGGVKGFTEPYTSIDIATSESGTISEINVEEGQKVLAKTILAKINEDVLLATLDVVKESVKSTGKLNSVLAEFRMQQMRVQRIEGLFSRQHASQNELDRAHSQFEIAKAQVEAARDELRVKSKEAQKIEAQLELRRLRSPIDGVVTEIYKEQGEFVSINEPSVLRVVQLNPLKVVFSMPRSSAIKMKAGEELDLEIGDQKENVAGLVEFVSPTADAQSGTCRVKVRIDNPELRWPSGVKCRIKPEQSGLAKKPKRVSDKKLTQNFSQSGR